MPKSVRYDLHTAHVAVHACRWWRARETAQAAAAAWRNAD